jgi:hypothetical protein
MSSTRTRTLHQLVAASASVVALLALGACGLDTDPPAQDISDVQQDGPTPAEGFEDEPRVYRHGGGRSTEECPPPPDRKYVSGPWVNPSEGCPQWWED